MSILGYAVTPIGVVCACAENGALCFLSLVPEQKEVPDAEDPLWKDVKQALERYFLGDTHAFDALPVQPHGTEFEMRVWSALREIPYGEVRTYGEIAKQIGCPGGARAVGGACNRNHILLVIPCHRVIGTKGKLTGFACGVEIKRQLLEHEHALLGQWIKE